MTKKSNKIYIGLNASYHDPSIALVDEAGVIVYAQATERFTQNKRSLFTVADNYSFVESIIKSFSFKDYEIATNWNSGNSLPGKMLSTVISYDSSQKYILLNRLIALLSGIKKKQLIHLFNFNYVANYSLRNLSGHTFRLLLSFNQNLAPKRIQNFNHHLCHAYHAYYTSSCNSSIILIIDGSGDYNTTISLYKADNTDIQKIHSNASDASLGTFYWILTHLCQLSSLKGEEWKVMGMAPYGKLNEKLYSDFQEILFVDGIELKKNKKKWNNFLNHKFNESTYSNIETVDIAYTGQLFFEDLLSKLITNIYKLYPHNNLLISGGCALNSSSIGKLHKTTPYKNIIVPFGSSDDGSAIGAALLNFKKQNPLKKIPNCQSNPYLGSEINDSELDLFKKHSNYQSLTLSYNELYPLIAKEIYQGKIIGWVQGKAEFGPRALGNRSILANPCLADMKDRINANIKFREEYRPFAPSVLEEYASDYFEDYLPTPYMERVLQIKKSKQQNIPAVTHIDGSGRLQTVSKSLNEHYYNLISAFHQISDVPILLNTSLNVMGKPIVNSISDIASIFSTSGLDIMVIHNTIFFKKNYDKNG